jgi:hypothetical protein
MGGKCCCGTFPGGVLRSCASPPHTLSADMVMWNSAALAHTSSWGTHLQVLEVERKVQDVGVRQVLSLQLPKHHPVNPQRLEGWWLHLCMAMQGTQHKHRPNGSTPMPGTCADAAEAARVQSTMATIAVACMAPISKVMTTASRSAYWSAVAGPAACWRVSYAATSLVERPKGFRACCSAQPDNGGCTTSSWQHNCIDAGGLRAAGRLAI